MGPKFWEEEHFPRHETFDYGKNFLPGAGQNSRFLKWDKTNDFDNETESPIFSKWD